MGLVCAGTESVCGKERISIVRKVIEELESENLISPKIKDAWEITACITLINILLLKGEAK